MKRNKGKMSYSGCASAGRSKCTKAENQSCLRTDPGTENVQASSDELKTNNSCKHDFIDTRTSTASICENHEHTSITLGQGLGEC